MFLLALLLQVPLVLSLFHAFFVSSPESFSVSEAISWCGGDLTSIIACVCRPNNTLTCKSTKTKPRGHLIEAGKLVCLDHSLERSDSWFLSLILVEDSTRPPVFVYTPGQVLVIGSREKEISTVMLGDFIRV
ncbi:hypothetical protein FB451DRAFT_1195251 [Mycena latifolia]|nr:hypothetical protein FB451DRAFT_1195251 [Mycena latifolia]